MLVHMLLVNFVCILLFFVVFPHTQILSLDDIGCQNNSLFALNSQQSDYKYQFQHLIRFTLSGIRRTCLFSVHSPEYFSLSPFHSLCKSRSVTPVETPLRCFSCFMESCSASAPLRADLRPGV